VSSLFTSVAVGLLEAIGTPLPLSHPAKKTLISTVELGIEKSCVFDKLQFHTPFMNVNKK